MILDWYAKITYYYSEHLWTAEQVAMGVVKNKITEEEYKTITGLDYVAPKVQ